MLRSLRVFALASFLIVGLVGCDSSPQATSQDEASQTERSAQKIGNISIDGPRQVAPGQECTWAGIYTDPYGSIDWYRDLQEKIADGAYYQGSFQRDTELEIKVYDSSGSFLNSEFIELEVCEGCEASQTECTNLTPVPAPL